MNGTRGPPLSVLDAFYRQWVSVVLDYVQTVFILRHAIVVGEGSSRLGVLQEVLPFSYLICFSLQEGICELDVPLVVHPLRWFFSVLGGSHFLG